jgi:hypothetical protein
MNDPYEDLDLEEDEGYSLIFAADEILLGDKGKGSPEWPEWHEAIKTKLGQLAQRGTWELIDKPAGAIPIMNKWVFTQKYNKARDLTKYKVRLVVKGCAQRPGYNYTETFSPVV